MNMSFVSHLKPFTVKPMNMANMIVGNNAYAISIIAYTIARLLRDIILMLDKQTKL
jgi:hypothetical protein